jgi:ArsR family metal-binding transcriptional regulator
MYGGGGESESEYNIPPPPPPEKKEIIHIPTPTLNDNIKDIQNVASDLGNVTVSAGVQGLRNMTNSTINSLGLDPNMSASENISVLNKDLSILNEELNNTKEGKELKENAGKLALDVVETLQPSINKSIDIVTEGSQKLSKSIGRVIVTGMNVFPPILAINELSNLATVAAQAGQTAEKLRETGAEASEKLADKKEEATSILNSLTTIINKAVKKGIDTSKTGVEILKKNVLKTPTSVQSAGGSLKKYNKTARMLGGRIYTSQSEFLSPYVNSSQILQQYGGKSHTRRCHKRLTSRRC